MQLIRLIAMACGPIDNEGLFSFHLSMTTEGILFAPSDLVHGHGLLWWPTHDCPTPDQEVHPLEPFPFSSPYGYFFLDCQSPILAFLSFLPFVPFVPFLPVIWPALPIVPICLCLCHCHCHCHSHSATLPLILTRPSPFCPTLAALHTSGDWKVSMVLGSSPSLPPFPPGCCCVADARLAPLFFPYDVDVILARTGP